MIVHLLLEKFNKISLKSSSSTLSLCHTISPKSRSQSPRFLWSESGVPQKTRTSYPWLAACSTPNNWQRQMTCLPDEFDPQHIICACVNQRLMLGQMLDITGWTCWSTSRVELTQHTMVVHEQHTCGLICRADCCIVWGKGSIVSCGFVAYYDVFISEPLIKALN